MILVRKGDSPRSFPPDLRASIIHAKFTQYTVGQRRYDVQCTIANLSCRAHAWIPYVDDMIRLLDDFDIYDRADRIRDRGLLRPKAFSPESLPASKDNGVDKPAISAPIILRTLILTWLQP